MFISRDADENSRLERLSLALLAAGAVAGMAALAAPAACGLLGGVIMALCIGNAIAIQFIKPEQDHFEHDSCEGEQLAAREQPAPSQQPAQAEAKGWTATVVARASASRSR
jgi:hypothetical protein